MKIVDHCTRTCSCSYQNQASLAFVHMPEAEMWTFSTYKGDDKGVETLGLNFGAPGDRITGDGMLWQRIDRFKRYALRMEPRDKLVWQGGHAGDAWITSGGLAGVESITVPVLMKGGKAEKNDKATRTYTVRMHFSGARGLDISLEGRLVASGVSAAGPVVKEFRKVLVTGPLDIELCVARGLTVINGLELILQE